METGRSQRRELVAPGIPALWKAMTEDNERAHALLSDMHAYAIRLNNAVLNLAHSDLHCGSLCPAYDMLLAGSGV
jgi:hypothetical protein